MANRKKEVYKPKPMTEGKRNLIQGLLQEYDIQSAEDIQDALKDLLSGTIQDMLETVMDAPSGRGVAWGVFTVMLRVEFMPLNKKNN